MRGGKGGEADGSGGLTISGELARRNGTDEGGGGGGGIGAEEAKRKRGEGMALAAAVLLACVPSDRSCGLRSRGRLVF